MQNSSNGADIRSWGCLPVAAQRMAPITQAADFLPSHAGQAPGLVCGMRRSYGDVCLNPGGTLWDATPLDRFISFDDSSGTLVCEPGLLLRDIQRVLLPRGWLLPVTPGTQLVTVGGAIANDVHGKNHHRKGSFGHHVEALVLQRTDGSVVHCGPNNRAEWFAATVGGLGLTGFIAQATLRLRKVPSAWLDTETLPYANLDEFFRLADDSEAEWEHTVSWIDCLSGKNARGLFIRGNYAADPGLPMPAAKRRSFPFTPPISLVNGLSLRAFNAAYFEKNRKAGRRLEHYEKYSYPLDDIQHWNRMYGPKGFYQYQCQIPRQNARPAIAEILSEIAKSGQGSFLAVLKTFGDAAPVGMLSFPKPGATLALDFPNLGDATLKLLNRLDVVVSTAGGRIYPAKDARMSAQMFAAGYPAMSEFLKFRDPGISSGMSRRLLGS